MKTAMNLLTDINVGPPREPFKCLSSDILETMKTDLKKLGYEPTIKYN